MLIELVFTLPILLAVVFAIVEYSILLGALLIMNNSTSEAAVGRMIVRGTAEKPVVFSSAAAAPAS